MDVLQKTVVQADRVMVGAVSLAEIVAMPDV